jgi:ubiquinone/menaquinone biosynthesis C-methylase UbiE
MAEVPESNRTESSRAHWQERSRTWAQNAPQGKTADDTFNQMIIAEAGIRPGEAVLDIASGTGNPAVSIALAMDGRGSVTCCDLEPTMLETARGRAVNLSLGIMRFVAADMTKLPFADASFDCVTCRFGLMFPADKVAAAREVLRVLKPGGRVAYVVWGAYDDNPPFFVPRRTVAAFFGESEGAVPSRHSMSAPGTLRSILDGAGFKRAEERALAYRNRVEDPKDYVAKGLRRSFAKKIEGLAPDRVAALEAALLAAWQPYREGAVLQVPNCARLGLGWKET